MDLYKSREFLSIEGLLQKKKIPSKTYTQNFYVNNKLSEMIEKEKDLELNRKLLDCDYNINDAYHNIMSSNLTDFSDYQRTQIKDKSRKTNIKSNKGMGFEDLSPQYADLMKLAVFPKTKPQANNLTSNKESIRNNEDEEQLRLNNKEQREILNNNHKEGFINQTSFENSKTFNEYNTNRCYDNKKFYFNHDQDKTFAKALNENNTLSSIKEKERYKLKNNLKDNLNKFKILNLNNFNNKRSIEINSINYSKFSDRKIKSVDLINNSHNKISETNLSITHFNDLINNHEIMNKNLNHKSKISDHQGLPKNYPIKTPWTQSLKVNCSNTSERSKNKNSFFGKRSKSGYVAIFHKDKKLINRYETLKVNYIFSNDNVLASDSSSEDSDNSNQFKYDFLKLEKIKDLSQKKLKVIDKKESGSKISKNFKNNLAYRIQEKKCLNKNTPPTPIYPININKFDPNIEEILRPTNAIFSKNQDKSIFSLKSEEIKDFKNGKTNKNKSLCSFREDSLQMVISTNDHNNKSNKNKIPLNQNENTDPRKKFDINVNLKGVLDRKHPASFLARCEKRKSSMLNLMNFNFKEGETEKKVFDKKTKSHDLKFNPLKSTNLENPMNFNKNSPNRVVHDGINNSEKKSKEKSLAKFNNTTKNNNKSQDKRDMNLRESLNNRRFEELRENLVTPLPRKSSMVLINSVTNIENNTNRITKSLSRNIKKYKIKKETEFQNEAPQEEHYPTLNKKQKGARNKNFMIASCLEERKKNFTNLSENRRSLLKMTDFIESVNDKIVFELKDQIESQYKKAAQKNGLINVKERLENKYSKILNNKNSLHNMTIEAKRLENSIMHTRNKIENKYFTPEDREKMKTKYIKKTNCL